MWRRLNNRDRQSPLGSPTSTEATTDGDILQHTTNLNDGSFSISSRPAFGRKQTGDILKGLPELPFKSLKVTPAIQDRPSSEVPTASSLYSQPSPELEHYPVPKFNLPPRSSSLYPEDMDVSPPGSLRTNDGGQKRSGMGSPDISPISESPSPSTSPLSPSRSSRYSSNIPVPKKTTKKFWQLPISKVDSPDRDSTITRWDDFSGEPTDSEKGKPPSTTPGAVKLNEEPIPGRLNHGLGTSTHISGGTVPARKRVGSREISDTPILMRPEWKGAGGRQKIVKPLLDKPLPPGQAPNYPKGSRKYEEELLRKQQEEEEERARERALQEQREREQDQQVQREREHSQREEREREQAEQEQGERARAAQEKVAMERMEQEQEQEQEQVKRDRTIQEQKAKVGQFRREQAEREQRERLRLEQERSKKQLAVEQSAQNTMNQPSIRLDTQELHQPKLVSGPRSGNSSEAVTTPESNQQNTEYCNGNLGTSDTRSPLARNPSNEEMKDSHAQALPALPQNRHERNAMAQPAHRKRSQGLTDTEASESPLGQDPSLIENRFRADLQQMHFQDEPRSRFSATTVATTTCDSPPATPEMDSESPSISTTPISILNRKRPVPPAGLPNAKVTARKPTPSEIQSSTPSSETKSNAKSLPKAPPDAPPVSPVATLQAKVDALRRRRNNLQTVIHELTHVVQPSSIAYDKASRQEIKKTVDGLNRELAEVQKDEHETGLKLHRAWKRHEDFAAYEPTSIWVRRVTS